MRCTLWGLHRWNSKILSREFIVRVSPRNRKIEMSKRKRRVAVFDTLLGFKFDLFDTVPPTLPGRQRGQHARHFPGIAASVRVPDSKPQPICKTLACLGSCVRTLWG